MRAKWNILVKDPVGVVIARRDLPTESHVKVYSESGARKFTHRTYKFPRVNESFNSPYCCWENLNCCGGWRCTESYLDTAVQEGKKLYAGRSEFLQCELFPDAPTLEEARENLQSLMTTLPDGVVAGEETCLEEGANQYFRTYICRTGRLEDYYDLDAVFAFYKAMKISLGLPTQKEIRYYCQESIESYGSRSVPFQYSNPVGIGQLITTGLLLGYPLESTASLLSGN